MVEQFPFGMSSGVSPACGATHTVVNSFCLGGTLESIRSGNCLSGWSHATPRIYLCITQSRCASFIPRQISKLSKQSRRQGEENMELLVSTSECLLRAGQPGDVQKQSTSLSLLGSSSVWAGCGLALLCSPLLCGPFGRECIYIHQEA